MYVTLSNDLRSKRFYGCFLVMLVDYDLLHLFYTEIHTYWPGRLVYLHTASHKYVNLNKWSHQRSSMAMNA